MTEGNEREHFRRDFWLWWVLVSTVALAASVYLGAVLNVALAPARVWILVGPAVGIAQWFLLRQEVSRAGWWMLASTVGVALGFAVILDDERGE